MVLTFLPRWLLVATKASNEALEDQATWRTKSPMETHVWRYGSIARARDGHWLEHHPTRKMSFRGDSTLGDLLETRNWICFILHWVYIRAKSAELYFPRVYVQIELAREMGCSSWRKHGVLAVAILGAATAMAAATIFLGRSLTDAAKSLSDTASSLKESLDSSAKSFKESFDSSVASFDRGVAALDRGIDTIGAFKVLKNGCTVSLNPVGLVPRED
ncbi:uncharacterized protein LOC9658262 [Selaginella moellendorffii]|uniref:uncharacterized protein LOC9658262 n=1 Tax=Selaginella moellendorffii TaxID=88036 RepID=UPI000D1C5DF8|nr:uncharacterized protein LOC9658262 [Selaginella moellendorffii]|eukprot:XP_024540762.1 uncharacterized protein LOC9658262 [Selaginella moellendorffii]